MVRLGFIAGGGIGEHAVLESSDNGTRFFLRFVFSLAYFILIKLIMLNIIFGIIVDTFAQLREERAFIVADTNSRCFICGINREQFDQNANGLEYHLLYEHSPFHYMAFVYTLGLIDETERNGIETHIGRMIRARDNKWLPMQKAIVLSQ
jgi:inositol 1,4,5-triphosphate receptor type 3